MLHITSSDEKVLNRSVYRKISNDVRCFRRVLNKNYIIREKTSELLTTSQPHTQSPEYQLLWSVVSSL